MLPGLQHIVFPQIEAWASISFSHVFTPASNQASFNTGPDFNKICLGDCVKSHYYDKASTCIKMYVHSNWSHLISSHGS